MKSSISGRCRRLWISFCSMYISLVAASLLLITYPIIWIKPSLYRTIIVDNIVRWMISLLAYIHLAHQYKVSECGDHVTDALHGRCLLLVNGHTVTDIHVIMHVLSTNHGGSDKVTWVLPQCQHPPFRLPYWLCGNIFVNKVEGETQNTAEFDNSLKVCFSTMGRKHLIINPEEGQSRLVEIQTKRTTPEKDMTCRIPAPKSTPTIVCHERKAVTFLKPSITPEKEITCRIPAPQSTSTSERKAVTLLQPKHRLPVVSAEKSYHELVNVGRPESGMVRSALSIMSTNDLHNANNAADSSAKFVIDVAIGLEGNKHRDGDRLHSDKEHKKNIHIHYRVFPVEQIPLESSSLTTWLDQLYVTKDNILQEFYQTGRFGRAQGNSSAKYETNPKSVYFSTSLIIALHIVIPIIFALEVTCFLYIIHMSCLLMMSVCLNLL